MLPEAPGLVFITEFSKALEETGGKQPSLSFLLASAKAHGIDPFSSSDAFKRATQPIASKTSTSQAFFSGQSSAPFGGNIRDLRTGDVVSVRSAKGQILLAAHKAGLSAALRTSPETITGAGVSFVEKSPPKEVIKPAGTQIGTRTSGGITVRFEHSKTAHSCRP